MKIYLINFNSSGLSLVKFHRSLEPSRSAQADKEAMICAWCLEILHAAFLVADDMMDRSTTRRGKACWHLVTDTAPNDVFLLELLVFHLVDKYFAASPKYVSILALLHDTVMQSILGQNMDIKMNLRQNRQSFTPHTYASIAEHKTSYYTFYQPVALAMILVSF